MIRCLEWVVGRWCTLQRGMKLKPNVVRTEIPRSIYSSGGKLMLEAEYEDGLDRGGEGLLYICFPTYI